MAIADKQEKRIQNIGAGLFDIHCRWITIGMIIRAISTNKIVQEKIWMALGFPKLKEYPSLNG